MIPFEDFEDLIIEANQFANTQRVCESLGWDVDEYTKFLIQVTEEGKLPSFGKPTIDLPASFNTGFLVGILIGRLESVPASDEE